MDGVLNDVFNSEVSDTSNSDEWIECEYEKSSDADVEIFGCSTSDRSMQSTFGASTDHVCINSDSGDADRSSRTSLTVSLLNVLKAPKLSSVSRKQTQVCNPNPPRGKRRCRGTSAHDPKGIRPIQRVKEYPDEPFSISNNKLFCKGCRELCVKKRSVTNRLEPIMLKNLPIIPSRTSQKFYPLFLIYSQIITYYSFIIHWVSKINVQNAYKTIQKLSC